MEEVVVEDWVVLRVMVEGSKLGVVWVVGPVAVSELVQVWKVGVVAA